MAMPWIFNSPGEDGYGADEFSSPTSSTTSSSSIGKNSDLWGSESSDSEEESEVQSVYKGKINLTDALEEALPIRSSISKFYKGRSKSFACLAEASSYPSIEDIGKPDNPYIRTRRSALSFKLRQTTAGISKASIASNSSCTLALGAALIMTRSETINTTNSDSSSSNSAHIDPNLKSLQRSHLPTRASYTNLISLSSVQKNVIPRKSISLPDLRKYIDANKSKK